jgi:hypothetical protein
MEQSTVITIFVALAAVAMIAQAGFLYGIYQSFKNLRERMSVLQPKIENLVTTSAQTVEQARQQVAEVTTRATEVLDISKRQLLAVEDVVNDASARAKVQLERAELILDDTLARVHETVGLVHRGVLKPLKEINAVSLGIRAFVQAFLRGGRPSVAQVTQDEEMFI